MGAPKNRKWEIGEKHHFVGTLVGVETGGGAAGATPRLKLLMDATLWVAAVMGLQMCHAKL